jgi:hypothetical protein
MTAPRSLGLHQAHTETASGNSIWLEVMAEWWSLQCHVRSFFPYCAAFVNQEKLSAATKCASARDFTRAEPASNLSGDERLSHRGFSRMPDFWPLPNLQVWQSWLALGALAAGLLTPTPDFTCPSYDSS